MNSGLFCISFYRCFRETSVNANVSVDKSCLEIETSSSQTTEKLTVSFVLIK